VAGIRAGEIGIGQTILGREITAIESRGSDTHSYDLLTEDSGYQMSGVPVNRIIEEMNAAARQRSTPH